MSDEEDDELDRYNRYLEDEMAKRVWERDMQQEEEYLRLLEHGTEQQKKAFKRYRIEGTPHARGLSHTCPQCGDVEPCFDVDCHLVEVILCPRCSSADAYL